MIRSVEHLRSFLSDDVQLENRRPSALDIFIPLLRNQRYRELTSEKKDDLDYDVIPNLSDFFHEMRKCRYIRWNTRDQTILQRMLEREILNI